MIRHKSLAHSGSLFCAVERRPAASLLAAASLDPPTNTPHDKHVDTREDNQCARSGQRARCPEGSAANLRQRATLGTTNDKPRFPDLQERSVIHNPQRLPPPFLENSNPESERL